jgi:hypothetical protein
MVEVGEGGNVFSREVFEVGQVFMAGGGFFIPL